MFLICLDAYYLPSWTKWNIFNDTRFITDSNLGVILEMLNILSKISARLLSPTLRLYVYIAFQI